MSAIGHAALWVVLVSVLPGVLLAVTRSFNETLAGISHFRTESMRRRREDELLGKIIDIDANGGLGHIERVRHERPLCAATPAVDPAPPTPSGDALPSDSPP
ncbi:hypothetical protein ACFZC7_39260 [Streptomyces massasporeus]|uniref:hypothetical protein n=1 Tax=Streptomyces massasporeus TaxID=67324 RepID=UPI002CEF025E|nr:hypothetical protein [Rugosimonospora sp.]